MKTISNQIAGAINEYELRTKCADFNTVTSECFEEIYKVCYVYWNKCLEKYKTTREESDKEVAEVIFMIGITEIIEILRPLFMVNVCELSYEWRNKLNIRGYVSGDLPSPMYFNFLLHTAKYKVCKDNLSSNFSNFVEILFMSGLEENNITGVIPFNLDNPSEKEIYDKKVLYGVNQELSISNTDIVSMIIKCRQ